jgi:hypothetical protein
MAAYWKRVGTGEIPQPNVTTNSRWEAYGIRNAENGKETPPAKNATIEANDGLDNILPEAES